MKNYFNTNAYLHEIESQYSGADGYEFDESSFDSNVSVDLSADGGGMAAQNLPQASPYVLQITNSTAGTLNAIIFGQNIYLLSTNYGSPTGITITSQSNVGYLQLLNQSSQQPFTTSLIRIVSTTTPQVTQQMSLTSTDASGKSITVPLITQSYFSPNQYQGGIVDFTMPIEVNGSTYLTYPVLAGLTVTMYVFPRSKANLSHTLAQGVSLQNFGAPNVPMTGTPVILRPAIASALKSIG